MFFSRWAYVYLLLATIQKSSPQHIPRVVESQRQKRIIWGTPLVDHNSYDVVGYMTYIARGHHYSFNLKTLWDKIFGGEPEPIGGSLSCGGALITPFIVTTACHCLADYFRVNATYQMGRVRNNWEEWYKIQTGYTMEREMHYGDGAFAKFAIIHQKCARLQFGHSYDFGLLIGDRPMSLWKIHMKLAPVYTARQITADYYNVMKKEAACLYVGFGLYRYASKERGILDKTNSPVLQHGWRRFMNYYDCRYETEMELEVPYEDYCTWMCSVFFGKQRAHGAPGDSGSPVTCNNVRVGLVSSRTEYPSTRFLNFIGASVHAMEYNAAEYQNELDQRIRADYVDADHSQWRQTTIYTLIPPGRTIGRLPPDAF